MSLLPKATIATRTALELHGDYEQRQIAVEELAELIVALKHYERGRISKRLVAEEIADVCIVVAQLADMFGREEIETQIEYKLERLMEACVALTPVQKIDPYATALRSNG
mgnify:FL=1